MTTSSTKTIRAFIAVRSNETAQTELVRVQRELKKELAHSEFRIKWTDPETFHITLLFLGDIPSDSVDHVFQALEKTVQNFSNIRTFLNASGFFKKSGAIWIGLDVSPEILAHFTRPEPGDKFKSFMATKIRRCEGFKPSRASGSARLTITLIA